MIPVLGQVGGQGLGRKVDVQVLGTKEGKTTDEVRAGRDGDFRQFRAVAEGVSTQEGHTLGNVKAGQTLAETESKIVDIGELGVTEVNLRQLTHTLQTVSLDRGQSASLLKGNGAKVGATVEHIGRNAFELAVFRKGEGLQLGTAHERALRHGGHVGGNSEGGQTATSECTVGDARQLGVLGKGHGVHIPVFGKCIVTDLHHAVGDGDACQPSVLRQRIHLYLTKIFGQLVGLCAATRKAVFVKDLNAVGQIDSLDMKGTIERIRMNMLQAFLEIHILQIPRTVKGGRTNIYNTLENIVFCSAIAGRILY